MSTYKFAGNILHTNIVVYIKAPADVKISTFMEKNRVMILWITKWTFGREEHYLFVLKCDDTLLVEYGSVDS